MIRRLYYEWRCLVSWLRCHGVHAWRVVRTIARWDRNGKPAQPTYRSCARCYLTDEGWFES